MRLELVPGESEPVLLTMKGNYFSPIVKVVIFSDLLVFLGARTWYRFEGMTSFDENLRQQDTDFRFPRPAASRNGSGSCSRRYESRIPGVKTAQIELIVKKAKEFATYGIMVQNDGGVEIVQKSGARRLTPTRRPAGPVLCRRGAWRGCRTGKPPPEENRLVDDGGDDDRHDDV